jgi:hypothetical protein
MQTYTAIALLSLLGITLSANAARALKLHSQSSKLPPPNICYPPKLSKSATARPERGSGRRKFTQPNVDTHPLQAF